MAGVGVQLQPVLVEYTFTNILDAEAQRLPGRVEFAVGSLVGRDRLPSDENVLHFIRENSSDAEGAEENTEEEGGLVVRIQIMLPHDIAVGVAIDRSFHTEQPCQDVPLTTTELRILTRRSVRARLRTLRRRLNRENILPREYETCVVCLEQVRYNCNNMTLECRHTFHRDCVLIWLAKMPRQCPTCRFAVDVSPRLSEEHLVAALRTRSSVHSDEEVVVL